MAISILKSVNQHDDRPTLVLHDSANHGGLNFVHECKNWYCHDYRQSDSKEHRHNFDKKNNTE